MLECWNNGKMGFGIMGQWFIGKIHFDHKNKKSIESLQINQYSIIPFFKSKTLYSKALYLFK